MRGIGVIILSVVWLFTACKSEEEPYKYSEKEVSRLISGELGRHWQRVKLAVNGQRVELNDCEKYQYYYFRPLINDSTKVFFARYVIGGMEDCYPNESDIFALDTGSWFVSAKPKYIDFPDTLVLQKHVRKDSLKVISNLSYWELQLEEVVIDTLISNRDTTIVENMISEWYEAREEPPF